MFLSWNESERRYCQKTAFRRHFSNMAARAAKIRGGKVEIRKEHIKIYKITHFQNSRKTFQVKLSNDCTNGCVRGARYRAINANAINSVHGAMIALANASSMNSSSVLA
jgi:hypothetical protein